VLVLLETAHSAAAVIALRGESVSQRAIDAFPRGENLRAGAFAHQPTRRIQDLSRGDLDAEVVGVDPEASQGDDQIGLRDNPCAAPGKLALHPLEDLDLPARAFEQQRGQKAAHRAADDERTPLARHSLDPAISTRAKLLYIGPKPGGMPWL
jgi:hypothetical protein